MKRNILEWAVLSVSVVAIAVVVGILVVDGLAETQPANPTVDLRVDDGYQGGGGWIIPASVRNLGNVAAEAVVIEASAQVDGEIETSELVVDFVPAGTEVEIAFAFSLEPEGDVTLRLVGFRVP